MFSLETNRARLPLFFLRRLELLLFTNQQNVSVNPHNPSKQFFPFEIYYRYLLAFLHGGNFQWKATKCDLAASKKVPTDAILLLTTQIAFSKLCESDVICDLDKAVNMPDNEKKIPVAYVPFKTFLAAIEGFEHSIPHQVDTSVWPTYSGAIKSQLLGSFKFLGLIDDAGRPMPELKTLAEDKVNRKVTLRKILESKYSKVVGVGLAKMTPKQFEELMREYGMEGSTHQKVVSFFIRAAKYAELPMAPLLGRKARSATRRRKAGGEETNGNRAEQASSQELSGGTASGTSKTVTLKSGGQLTLILSVNVFDLNPSDREFVFGMIDKLQHYERAEETNSK